MTRKILIYEKHSEEKTMPFWMNDHTKAVESKKGELNLGELLFFIAFFSFCLKYTQDYSVIIPHNILNVLLAGLCVMASVAKICLQRYTLRRLLLTLFVCALIGYSALTSTNNIFLYGFLIVIAMQDIDLIKVIKAGFYFKLISIITHVLIYTPTYFLNPSAIEFSFRAGDPTPQRHYFFMGHANLFMGFLIWTCLDFIFINYKRLKFFHMVVIWLINIIFYSFTYSNSGIIVLAIVTILIIMDKSRENKFDKLFSFLAKYMYVFFSFFFPLLTVIYTRLDGMLREMWHELDLFLTGRIWYGAYEYYISGFTIFGRPDKNPVLVFWEGRWFDTFTVFDNYYIGNFVSYGIINLIIIAIALIALCGKMENREKILIVAFALFAIMDSGAINLAICSSLLILGKYIYNNNKYQNN